MPKCTLASNKKLTNRKIREAMKEYYSLPRERNYSNYMLNNEDEKGDLILWNEFPRRMINNAAKCATKFYYYSDRAMKINNIDHCESHLHCRGA